VVAISVDPSEPAAVFVMASTSPAHRDCDDRHPGFRRLGHFESHPNPGRAQRRDGKRACSTCRGTIAVISGPRVCSSPRLEHPSECDTSTPPMARQIGRASLFRSGRPFPGGDNNNDSFTALSPRFTRKSANASTPICAISGRRALSSATTSSPSITTCIPCWSASSSRAATSTVSCVSSTACGMPIAAFCIAASNGIGCGPTRLAKCVVKHTARHQHDEQRKDECAGGRHPSCG
jgi:hypothetical protein